MRSLCLPLRGARRRRSAIVGVVAVTTASTAARGALEHLRAAVVRRRRRSSSRPAGPAGNVVVLGRARTADRGERHLRLCAVGGELVGTGNPAVGSVPPGSFVAPAGHDRRGPRTAGLHLVRGGAEDWWYPCG